MHKLFPECERQRIKERKTLKEIHESTSVAMSTLSKWNRANEWEKRMNDWQASSLSTSETLKYLLAEDVKALKKKGKVDNGDVDRVIKMTKAIKSLNEDADILAVTLIVMDQYANFLQMKSAKLFRDYQNILPQFLNYMREKFKK